MICSTKPSLLMRSLGSLRERSGDGQVDDAEQWYRRAILLSDEIGMRPEAAHARRDLATLLRRAGRNEEATVQQASARDLRRAMGLIGRLRNEEAPKPHIGRRPQQPRTSAHMHN